MYTLVSSDTILAKTEILQLQLQLPLWFSSQYYDKYVSVYKMLECKCIQWM